MNLLERRRDILVRHVDRLREAVRRTREERPFHIDAWVVMPDHLHCVWTLPPGDDDFSNRWKAIKIRFVRGLPRTEGRSAVRQAKGERGTWQRRFWEHLIRGDCDYAHHVDYVHWNPVKHGYVDRMGDWRCSSFHRYLRLGVLPTDWTASIDKHSDTCGEESGTMDGFRHMEVPTPHQGWVPPDARDFPGFPR